jgi:hypothetical protein
MLRYCSGPPISKDGESEILIYRFTDLPIYRFTDLPIYRFTDFLLKVNLGECYVKKTLTGSCGIDKHWFFANGSS